MKLLWSLVLTTLLLTLEGCQPSGSPSQPLRTLVLTMRWQPASQVSWNHVTQELAAGTLSLHDGRFANPTCDFVAGYNLSPPAPQPSLNLNGTPGDPGFNVDFRSTQLSGNQCQSCCGQDVPTEMLIQSERGLVLGQVGKGGLMTVSIGSDVFTADYREFTLTSVNSGNRTANGTFQMLATNHANPQDQRALIVVDGSFSATF